MGCLILRLLFFKSGLSYELFNSSSFFFFNLFIVVLEMEGRAMCLLCRRFTLCRASQCAFTVSVKRSHNAVLYDNLSRSCSLFNRPLSLPSVFPDHRLCLVQSETGLCSEAQCIFQLVSSCTARLGQSSPLEYNATD